MFLFLVLMLDLKLAVWVSVGIATAFMGGFLFFGALGVTVTMISLFGLIIVLGLVVDDAIVIGENIDAERERGGSGESAAVRGSRRMLAPVIVGVLTSVAAFAPLLVTGGTFGDITRAIPLVVIDTYEHAFYIDYENRKAEYVEKFMDHVDWDQVNARFRFRA